MYIPEKRKNRQITLFDFNQSCGMELDPINVLLCRAPGADRRKDGNGIRSLWHGKHL